jgi:uncharacterized protein (UPF0254 family)
MNELISSLFVGMGIGTIVGIAIGTICFIDTLRMPDFRHWQVITNINKSENTITYKDIKTGSISKKIIK